MSTAGINEGRLTRAFLEEAEELTSQLGELLGTHAPGDDPQRINEIFRIVHSLKSEAALAGFPLLSELAHRMEDALDLVRQGSLALGGAALSAVVDGADLIASTLTAIGRGEGEAALDSREAIAALRAVTGSQQTNGPQPAATRAGFEMPRPLTVSERARIEEALDRGESLHELSFAVEDAEPLKFARAYLVCTSLEQVVPVVRIDPSMEGEPADDARYGLVRAWFTSRGDGSEALAAAKVDAIRDARIVALDPAALLAQHREQPSVGPPAAAGPAPSPSPAVDERTSIRVDARKLDELWTLVAELVQHKARLATIAERLGRGIDPREARAELTGAFDDLEKISGGMQQTMVETRMVPISVIFSKFPRLVRELSRKLGKSIELDVAGGDTEIDRGIVEALSDPLTHLIRNAIDHGIEFPEERVRLGKPERGRVRIAASQQGGRIVIEIVDDGHGLDPPLIRRRAIALGIPGAAGMDERRLLELVFLPGFSTREVVTDLSGRGVGMDVVATRVRTALKGDVLLDTGPGRGTRVTLLLPLTLTIVRALVVRSDDHLFAVPIAGVHASTRVVNTEIRGAGADLTWSHQGEEIPLYSIGGLLGRSLRRAEEHAAVIVSQGPDRGCLLVDELLDEQELVIKPIDDLANHGRLFSGVAVREDGSFVFILDTSFVREGGGRREAAWVPAS